MQKISLIGRLGRDAQLREGQNGKRFLAFTVAANSQVRGAEKTTWYDVISFNERHMGKFKDYLTKGSSIVVIGDLDARIDCGNDGVNRLRLTVTADSIEFASSGNSGNTQTVNEEVASSATSVQSKPKVSVEPEVPADDAPVVVTTKTTRKSEKKVITPETLEVGDDSDLPF